MLIAVVLIYGIVILLVSYLFRALATMVNGLRSVNEHTRRIAHAVEKLSAESVSASERTSSRHSGGHPWPRMGA